MLCTRCLSYGTSLLRLLFGSLCTHLSHIPFHFFWHVYSFLKKFWVSVVSKQVWICVLPSIRSLGIWIHSSPSYDEFWSHHPYSVFTQQNPWPPIVFIVRYTSELHDLCKVVNFKVVPEIRALDICVDYVLSSPFGNNMKDLRKSPPIAQRSLSLRVFLFVAVLVVKSKYVLEVFV